MLNYLKEYGQVSLQETPLNDVDRLIFAQLAYVDWQDALPGMSLTAALGCVRFDSEDTPAAVRFAFQHRDDRALCSLAAQARRYAGMQLEDYTCVWAKEAEAQFAAVTFRMADGTLLVAFRGTDNTLAGWKEDFNMAFMEAMPSQLMARDYVNRLAAEADAVELCGHSKGGNLALYAACACDKRIQGKIRCAVSFDGPGLKSDMLESREYLQAEERLRTVMPCASLIGRLFAQPRHTRLVECRMLGLMQHYPYFWKVQGMDFITAEAADVGGAILSGAMMGMMERVDPATREHFVEAVYEIISSAQADTVNELLRHWGRSALQMARKLRETDRETYRVFLRVGAAFWRAALSALGENIRKK